MTPMLKAGANFGLLHNLERFADRTALVDVSDGSHERRYTFRELDQLAAQVADGLIRKGYALGDRIGILSHNSAEMVAIQLGIMRAGLVCVPLNHRLPRTTLEYVVADCQLRLLFAEREMEDRVPAGLSVVWIGGQGQDTLGTFTGRGEEVPSPKFDPDAVCMILYTSGSSGRPKGVPITHAGQLWVTSRRSIVYDGERPDRLLVAAPIYHVNGHGYMRYGLHAGCTVTLMREFDPVEYIRAIERYQCTVLTSVPTMMSMLLFEETLEDADLSSVRRVSMGSSPVTQSLLEQVRSAFPNAEVVIGYGTTEAGAAIFGQHPRGLPAPDLTLGHPIEDVEVRLRSPDGSTDGDSGVLEVRCPAVMKGYLNLPDRTREVLSPDGWYNTGDMMSRDRNGFFFFTGRADDVFICGGENIHPDDVERVLETHPDVKQAVVVAVPDEVKGEKPVAFIVMDGNHKVSEREMKQYFISRAPAFMHPRRIYFVQRFPLSSTNKVDRARLKGIALAMIATDPQSVET